MHRFTAPGPFTSGSLLTLDKTQSHHLTKVLRLEEGAELLVIDGVGHVARAKVADAHAKASTVKIGSVDVHKPHSATVLCFAVPKGQALDFLIRRTTELGVAAFQPLQTKFSSPIKGWNAQRWESVVAEVCKQCEDPFFPKVLPPRTLLDWLASREPARPLVLCDEHDRASRIETARGGADLVIGAEGGFSEEESKLLRNSGAVLMGLGRNRLRAETAALVALTLLKQKTGEMG